MSEGGETEGTPGVDTECLWALWYGAYRGRWKSKGEAPNVNFTSFLYLKSSNGLPLDMEQNPHLQEGLHFSKMIWPLYSPLTSISSRYSAMLASLSSLNIRNPLLSQCLCTCYPLSVCALLPYILQLSLPFLSCSSQLNCHCLMEIPWTICSKVTCKPEMFSVISLETLFVQLLSHVQLFVTSWTVECQAPLSSTISQGLLKLMSIELAVWSNHQTL